MIIYWILLALGAVLLLMYIPAKLRKYDVKELLLKTFTSVSVSSPFSWRI